MSVQRPGACSCLCLHSPWDALPVAVGVAKIGGLLRVREVRAVHPWEEHALVDLEVCMCVVHLCKLVGGDGAEGDVGCRAGVERELRGVGREAVRGEGALGFHLAEAAVRRAALASM